jgi:hypothetical protein
MLTEQRQENGSRPIRRSLDAAEDEAPPPAQPTATAPRESTGLRRMSDQTLGLNCCHAKLFANGVDHIASNITKSLPRFGEGAPSRFLGGRDRTLRRSGMGRKQTVPVGLQPLAEPAPSLPRGRPRRVADQAVLLRVVRQGAATLSLHPDIAPGRILDRRQLPATGFARRYALGRLRLDP